MTETISQPERHEYVYDALKTTPLQVCHFQFNAARLEPNGLVILQPVAWGYRNNACCRK